MPLHRHQVELEFARFELQLEHSFIENWDLWLRLPFEVKRRRASIEFIEAVDSTQRQAILRNQEIHHPSKTLEGFSDFSLLVAHRLGDLVLAADMLDLALGSTLPVGKIERDPFALGDAGLAHEHIQFGNGSFDPLVELAYRFAPARDWSLSLTGRGRFPLYENRHRYQGPIEGSGGIGARWTPTEWLGLDGGLVLQCQDFAHWDGERDVNSGWVTFSGGAGFDVRLWQGGRLQIGFRLPIWNQVLHRGGDAFEQGPLVFASLSASFGS